MKASYYLTVLATVFAAIAAATGLFVPSLYQDNAFVKTAWHGNDWVTLLVVVPTILLVMSRAGSNYKARLVWMGLLGYMVYNYAFYLFGAVYNKIFLVYVLIFSLSLFALISGLSSLAKCEINFTGKTRGWIVAYLTMIVVVLCMVEVIPNFVYIFSGIIPDTITLTDHPTAVVYALDLSLVVPVSALAIVMLLRRQFWGYVLAAIMLVKGATYGLVLVVNSLLLALRGTGEDALLPFYAFIMFGGVLSLYWLLTNTAVSSTLKPGEAQKGFFA